jgi:hypothetical protein
MDVHEEGLRRTGVISDLCSPGISVSSMKVTVAMVAATIFSTNQPSATGRSRRSSSSFLPGSAGSPKATCATLLCVLSMAAGFLHLGTWTIRQSISQLSLPPSPWTSLPVIPFQYLTTYVSGCDGRVSIGTSSKMERIPAALVMLGLRNTEYSVNIRRNWNQKPTSSYLCELKPATTLTYPVATMRVFSAYRPTWQGAALTGIGTFTPGSTSRDSIRRSTSFGTRMRERKSSRGMVAHLAENWGYEIRTASTDTPRTNAMAQPEEPTGMHAS